MSARTYFDHNATSPLRPEAREAMRAALDGAAGNPSSLHAEGRAARARIETARTSCAKLAGCAPSEAVFTSGGTEAIAAGFHGVLTRASDVRRRVVVSAVEHSSVLESAREAGRRGFEVSVVPCDGRGWVDPEAFAARLDEDVALAALQWVNPETGVVQPIDEVAAACALRAIPFLVDAVQAAGKLPLGMLRARPDLVALSAHKLGGPQGTGLLVVGEGLAMAPLLPGGAQEKRRRGGTEAVAGIAGFGAASEAAVRDLSTSTERIAALRDRIESCVLDRFRGARIHGAGTARVAGTTSFALPGVPGEMLVIALDLAGFALSTGSACASGAIEPSHVLRAMGFAADEARGAVRLSLGWSSSAEEVERFLEALPAVAERVRTAGNASELESSRPRHPSA